MHPDKYNKALYKLVGDLFAISAYYQSGKNAVLNLSPRYNQETSIKLLKDRLKMAGYTYSLDVSDDSVILTIDPKASFRIPKINIILFLVTLFTVYVIPVYFRNLNHQTFMEDIYATYNALLNGEGIVFTIAMISILFIHEMGHYIASRRRNIITSYPYFIPAPNIIGTFGAIIKSKSPFWNRMELIEVGAAGPIAGWIIAVGWLCYGIFTSEIIKIDQHAAGLVTMGSPIIINFISNNIIGTIPKGYDIVFNEAAFAGWVGMLVTAINMLPIGQLDGGHIVYGLFRKYQHIVSYGAMGMLFVLGYYSPMWWLFAFLGLIFGMKHPPTLNDGKSPGKSGYTMGIVALIILVLSFTPIPFQ